MNLYFMGFVLLKDIKQGHAQFACHAVRGRVEPEEGWVRDVVSHDITASDSSDSVVLAKGVLFFARSRCAPSSPAVTWK